MEQLGVAPEYLAAVARPGPGAKQIVVQAANRGREGSPDKTGATSAAATFRIDGKHEPIPSHVVSEVTGTANLILSNGVAYVGDVLNGVKHGRGTLTLADGTRYAGDFVDNRLEGVGVLTYPDGSEYRGDVVNGRRHGTGTFTYTGGSAQYVGSWVHGKREGTGRLFFGPGRSSYYRGQWAGDVRQGQGLVRYPSGAIYAGQWVNDKKHGLGRIAWIDRAEEYVGRWENDVQEGFGVHTWYVALPPTSTAGSAPDEESSSRASIPPILSPTVTAAHKIAAELGFNLVLPDAASTVPSDCPFAGFAVGSRYRGYFSRGRRHGFGTYHYANGSRYCGEWHADTKQGHGLYVAADGACFDGLFWDDQPILSGSVSGVGGARSSTTAAASSIGPSAIAPTLAANALNMAMSRPLYSDPLFSLHIADLLPPECDLLAWYAATHAQRADTDITGAAASGAGLAGKLRTQALSAVENVVLRWNSRLTGWYNQYARFGKTGTASSAAIQGASGSVQAYASAFAAVPSHLDVVASPSSLSSYFNHLLTSVDNGCPSPTQPLMRLHQLWRFVLDCGLTRPPAITLTSINELLLDVRVRQCTGVIQGACRLAELAARVVAEQRVQQQQQQSQSEADEQSHQQRGGGRGRQQRGSAGATRGGGSASRIRGGSKSLSGGGNGSSAREEKKGEDDNHDEHGERDASAAAADGAGQSSSSVPLIPPEAAAAVVALVKSELRLLQDAQRACHDPDTPILYREFVEVIVRLAHGIHRVSGSALPVQFSSSLTDAAAASSSDSSSSNKAPIPGPLVNPVLALAHANSVAQMNGAAIGTGRSYGGGASTVMSLVSGRDLYDGSGRALSPEKIKAMNYGRINRDLSTQQFANSITAVTNAPKARQALPQGQPELNLGITTSSVSTLPSPSATTMAAPGLSSPEDLAFLVDCCLYYHIQPFACAPPQVPALQPSPTNRGLKSGGGTGRVTISEQSSKWATKRAAMQSSDHSDAAAKGTKVGTQGEADAAAAATAAAAAALKSAQSKASMDAEDASKSGKGQPSTEPCPMTLVEPLRAITQPISRLEVVAILHSQPARRPSTAASISASVLPSSSRNAAAGERPASQQSTTSSRPTSRQRGRGGTARERLPHPSPLEHLLVSSSDSMEKIYRSLCAMARRRTRAADAAADGFVRYGELDKDGGRLSRYLPADVAAALVQLPVPINFHEDDEQDAAVDNVDPAAGSSETYRLQSKRSTRPSSLSHHGGAITVRDVVTMMVMSGLVEKAPSDVPEAEVKKLAVGHITPADGGDAPKPAAAAPSAAGPEARRPSVVAAAAAKPAPSPAGKAHPGAAHSTSGKAAGSATDAASSAGGHGQASPAVGSGGDDAARSFASKFEPLSSFISECEAATESVPVFDVAAVLRSIYATVRPRGGAAHAKDITLSSVQPVPSSYSPSTASSSANGGAAHFASATSLAPASTPMDQQPGETLAGIRLPLTIDVPVDGTDSGATDSSDRSDGHASGSTTLLVSDLLSLPLVKCEFMESLLRSSALYTATIAARRAHIEKSVAGLESKAALLLGAAESDAQQAYKRSSPSHAHDAGHGLGALPSPTAASAPAKGGKPGTAAGKTGTPSKPGTASAAPLPSPTSSEALPDVSGMAVDGDAVAAAVSEVDSRSRAALRRALAKLSIIGSWGLFTAPPGAPPPMVLRSRSLSPVHAQVVISSRPNSAAPQQAVAASTSSLNAAAKAGGPAGGGGGKAGGAGSRPSTPNVKGKPEGVSPAAAGAPPTDHAAGTTADAEAPEPELPALAFVPSIDVEDSAALAVAALPIFLPVITQKVVSAMVVIEEAEED